QRRAQGAVRLRIRQHRPAREQTHRHPEGPARGRRRRHPAHGAGDQEGLCGTAQRSKKKVTSGHRPAPPPLVEWTGWRGPHRDGRVAWLPDRLPAKPKIIWRKPMLSKGLGGVAATKDHVIVSGRELMDSSDAYYCFRADTGKEVWKV